METPTPLPITHELTLPRLTDVTAPVEIPHEMPTLDPGVKEALRTAGSEVASDVAELKAETKPLAKKVGKGALVGAGVEIGLLGLDGHFSATGTADVLTNIVLSPDKKAELKRISKVAAKGAMNGAVIVAAQHKSELKKVGKDSLKIGKKFKNEYVDARRAQRNYKSRIDRIRPLFRDAKQYQKAA